MEQRGSVDPAKTPPPVPPTRLEAPLIRCEKCGTPLVPCPYAGASASKGPFRCPRCDCEKCPLYPCPAHRLEPVSTELYLRYTPIHIEISKEGE